MIRYVTLSLALFVAALHTGCSSSTSSDSAPTLYTGPDPSGLKYLLSEEPAGAKGVAEIRKTAKNGNEVVVVGKIGGSKDPWVEGRASFTIVDTSLKSCLDTGDGCPTPWDYCCTPEDELHPSMVSIKIVDANGQTVGMDARRLLGVKELDTVVIKGKVKQEGGAFFVQANSVFIRK